VTSFNVFLQDNTNPNNVLLFNTQTGAYRYCCSGSTFTGVGVVARRGCIYTLTHNAVNRRVSGEVDFTANRGTASLQTPPGKLLCSISDSNLRNNTPACGVAP
jgi:hypothetical protein